MPTLVLTSCYYVPVLVSKVNERLKNTKRTLIYKKSNYMRNGSNYSETNNFDLKINHNTISQTNNVEYQAVFLDN